MKNQQKYQDNTTVEHTKMPNEENAFLFQKNTEHTQ